MTLNFSNLLSDVCINQQYISIIACPHENFNLTQGLRFLFVFIVLDFRKKTKKRFRKSVNNFLRYEFFLYLNFGRFVEQITMTIDFSQITKFGNMQLFRKLIQKAHIL